ncbi:MAG: hypothetical protein L6R30_20130 [Thermoanaerobaculia bacterium]|nr:hypothetical protein [Thermoanaerobaculia bacterium]
MKAALVVIGALILVLIGRWSASPGSDVIIRPAQRTASGQKLPESKNGAQPGPTPVAPPSAEIAADIAALEAQIRRAEEEDAKYAGGLVKALIGSELHILRQSKAMLEQRARSWTFGIGLTYQVDGRPFVAPANAPELLAEVEQEIRTTKERLAEAQAETAKYAGGLVLALSHSTEATIRNTLAMLEQKRLALKYSLPQYIGFQGSQAPSAPGPGSPTANPSPVAERQWRIVEVDSRVTESNDTWWRYAWKLTLANDSDLHQAFDATIEFQDADGFVVDSASEYNLVVPPHAERTFTGYSLVSVPGASRVARTNAKVKVR